MQYWNTILKILLLLLILNIKVNAQQNSPYSRYGIGDIKVIENVANRGMGGFSIADNNTLLINVSNPASYAFLKMTTYQLAVEATSVNVKNSTSANQTGYAGLSYFNVAFPILKDKAAVSFGLLPQTRSKYYMQQNSFLNATTPIEQNYFGGGSIQKVYIGGAYEYKGISLGTNLGYSFGNYQNNSETVFNDTSDILRSNFLKRTVVGGAFAQFGLLAERNLNKNYMIKFGATYSLGQTLNATRQTSIISSYLEFNPGDTINTRSRTIYEKTDEKGKINLPSQIGLGLQLINGDKWQIGVDYTSSDWSKYTSYGEKEPLGKQYLMRMGMAYTPDNTSTTSSLKRITYRTGFNFGQDLIYINNTKSPISTFTLGLGYPIRRTLMSIGQINAALEVGKRGSISNGLIAENYTRFVIGITVNDRWFLKRKYD